MFTDRILENHIYGPKTKNGHFGPFWPFLSQVGQNRHKNIFSSSRDQMISNVGHMPMIVKNAKKCILAPFWP